MARVLCTLPNASDLINGVRFASTPNGMLSARMTEERAAEFAMIRGYVLVDDDGAPVKPAPEPEAPPPQESRPPAVAAKAGRPAAA